MGTNATVVISNMGHGDRSPPKVLAGLYAQFDGGVSYVGAAVLRALERVAYGTQDFLHHITARSSLTPEQSAEMLNWRMGYEGGFAVVVIARLFNEVDMVVPGTRYNIGDEMIKGADRRGSHNTFLLETPDRIDLDNSIYRYFIEPRMPEEAWLLAGLKVQFPRPWLKAMYGTEVIFEGWPEDAEAVFEAWEAKRLT